MTLLLCVTAFFAAFFCGRASLGLGAAVVLWAGGLYGIVRANYLDTFSYFTYDAAVVGLYLARVGMLAQDLSPRNSFQRWFVALLAWPVAVLGFGFAFPQHVLVQLVGLRAAVWFLPFIALGSRMTRADLRLVALGLAAFDLFALLVAGAEYYWGVETFFPRNAVTELIYKAKDIAGFTAYRIPSTFSSSAAYGGFMVATVPFLLGRLAASGSAWWEKLLCGAALPAALLGIFLCGSRSPVVLLAAMCLFFVVYLRRALGTALIGAVIVAAVGVVVSENERLQRFTTLYDPETTLERLQGSANVGVLELLADYPMGVGLGGAVGTSIPEFLRGLAPEQVGAENEWARIGLEQGLLGLGLWACFVGWVLWPRRGAAWMAPGAPLKLLHAHVLVSWAACFIGTGLLSAIPLTALLFLEMGMIGAPAPQPRVVVRRQVRRPVRPEAGGEAVAGLEDKTNPVPDPPAALPPEQP